MAYTVGAGTCDDIAFSTGTSLGADNGSQFVCGWWYPTTLTATRGYWSAGATFGAEVDGTTSEIRMRTDNTTDGQWVTSGAGITTDKWWFLAWLNASENTTVAGAWKVWVGDLQNPPVSVTVTNPTVRSGNYTGSSSCVIGNKGTGTLAFQGGVGWGAFMVTTTVGVLGPFGIRTSGVNDAYAEELTYRRRALPFLSGNPDISQFTPAANAAAMQMVHFSGDLTGRLYRRGQANVDAHSMATLNGVTYSAAREPIPLNYAWPDFPKMARR